jgi:hypothetical protein
MFAGVHARGRLAILGSCPSPISISGLYDNTIVNVYVDLKRLACTAVVAKASALESCPAESTSCLVLYPPHNISLALACCQQTPTLGVLLYGFYSCEREVTLAYASPQLMPENGYLATGARIRCQQRTDWCIFPLWCVESGLSFIKGTYRP